MGPITDLEGKDVTLSVTKGPSMHAISAALCPAHQDHRVAGVTFQVTLPCKEFGRNGTVEIYPVVVLSEYKALDPFGEMAILGGYFKANEWDWNLFKKAPVQITNYSIKHRNGNMQISYEMYISLFHNKNK